MGKRLKDYVAAHYPPGKRDLFAAFILRCLSLARQGGSVAMMTQQSWMFLRSFAAMRKKILEDEAVEALAHLGPRAFTEITGEVVSSVLFVIRHARAPAGHRLWSARLIGPKSAAEKADLLSSVLRGEAPKVVATPQQKDLLGLPETPIVYWLRPKFFDLLAGRTSGDVADVCQGLATADDARFVRFTWEVPPAEWAQPVRQRRWVPFEKGGGYGKWFGHHSWVVDWESDGVRLKVVTIERYGNAGKRVYNEQYYFKPGYTYSFMARGSLGVRQLMPVGVFGAGTGAGVMPKGQGEWRLAGLANCHLSSYVVRSLSAKIQLNESYVLRVPLPEREPDSLPKLEPACLTLKRWLVAHDPTEWSFDPNTFLASPGGERHGAT